MEQKEQPVVSKYQQIIKEKRCKLAIFGIEDFQLLHEFIQILTRIEPLRCRNGIKSGLRYTVNTAIDTIKYYKSINAKMNVYINGKGIKGSITHHIINAFLTEEAYKHETIKYSNIIEPGTQTHSTTIWYRHAMYSDSLQFPIPTINNDNDDDIKEEATLREKHILEADAFMIVFDVRYQEELDKLKNYLDEIFRIKGYDKLLSKMKRDEMCFFPISLIGINLDFQGDYEGHKISIKEINTLSMDYCVDNDRMELVDDDWYRGYMTKVEEISAFTRTVLDYYYYRSLSPHQIHQLRFKSQANSSNNSNCCIL